MIGAVTGGAGAFFLQAASIFVFALIGAFAGWIFLDYLKPILKPKMDKLFRKKD